MNAENFNKSRYKKRILVAPLDWGLGHATRCIPIIRELILQNCEVIIAAAGPTKALLQQEFPQIKILYLKGYGIRYSRQKIWLPFTLLLQIPRLFNRILYEHRWLGKAIKTYAIDGVISDNRFGLYHSFVPCIYITHQLNIKTGYSLTRWFLQILHYYYINKYRGCWVPDAKEANNLAGTLSHPRHMPRTTVKYMGTLSRFDKIDTETRYDLTVILSGPEPQRSVLERLVMKELRQFEGKCLLVRGFPNDSNIHQYNNDVVEIHNHLPASELNKAIQQSRLIISRSGYTTIMDLVCLRQRAVLIPTPGQTEQVYLAGHLDKKGIFPCLKQTEFSLQGILNKVSGFPFLFPEVNREEYKSVIGCFITDLEQVKRTGNEILLR